MDDAGVAWDMAVESDLDNAVEAVVSADLAVTAVIPGVLPHQTSAIDHGGVLPNPGETRIILYMEQSDDAVMAALRELIRVTYRGGWGGDAKPAMSA